MRGGGLSGRRSIPERAAPGNAARSAARISRRSAPSVAVESAVDSRSVARETGGASFLVAAPDLPQRRKLRALQRGLRAGGAEDHADIVPAGTIDGVPQRVDFVLRHPVLRVQEDDGIDLAIRQAF